jgi:hypothetical protein
MEQGGRIYPIAGALERVAPTFGLPATSVALISGPWWRWSTAGVVR